MQESLPADLIEALRDARSVVVLTGAGVSAESGVPTFRDAMEGHWAKFDPMQLATPEAFERDPETVSRWYDWRREMLAGCEPNPGHIALARLEREMASRGRGYRLLTQNVDRLHHAAGSVDPVELHGSIWVWRCTGCGDAREERDIPFAEHPPRCAACGGVRRPGVVWFGEMLPVRAIEESERVLNSCDVFFSVGTSALVHPAAGFAAAARAAGALTCEINRDKTPVSGMVTWSVRGASGELLPALIDAAFAG